MLFHSMEKKNGYLINNSAYNSFAGFLFYSSPNNSVSNNTAISCYRGFSLSSGSSNNSFSNNSAYNSGASGFDLSSSSSNNSFFGNFAYNSSSSGFGFSQSQGNKLINNSVYNSGYSGFQFYASPNNTLSNNSAYNSSPYGFYFHANSDNNSLSNNSAYDSINSGFFFDSASNTSLNGNSAYNSALNGFYISSSSNNSLSNNLAYNSTTGFNLDSSKSISLSNNTANMSLWGFLLFSSIDSSVTTNYAYNSNDQGFWIYSSSNNSLSNNTASMNGVGFKLSYSSNNFLSNNTANISSFGFYLSSSPSNLLSNNSASVSSDTGFFLTANSNNNSLSNNSAYNSNDTGFIFYYSSNNSLSGNSAYNSTNYGFSLGQDSDSNNLSNNYAYNSTQRGFYLSQSPNNSLTTNTANLSTFGFSLSFSPDNYLFNNSALNSTNLGDGFNIDSSPNCTLSKNFANNSDDAGFRLYSWNDTLMNNLANNSGMGGFVLVESPNNSLSNNNAYNTALWGYYLISSNDNSLSSNSAYDSNATGFYLTASSNNALERNNAYNSNRSGFELNSNSNFNNLSNNSAYNSTAYGFILSTCSNNLLARNNATLSGLGFILDSSTNNSLSNNMAFNSTHSGFALYDSSSNILSENSAQNSSWGGFYLESFSKDNNLINNVAGQNQYGFHLHFGINNNLSGNDASFSSSSGFYLYQSSNNTLSQGWSHLNEVGITSDDSFLTNTISSNRITNSNQGVFVINSNDTYFNNTINCPSDKVCMNQSTNDRSLFYNNILTGDHWVTTDDLNGPSYTSFNTSQHPIYEGNIYYFANGTPSWKVFDIHSNDNDNWSDEGNDWPFNQTTLGSALWNSTSTDWHPYTENETAGTCEQSSLPACFAACPTAPKNCSDITDAFCSCECPQYDRFINASSGDQKSLDYSDFINFTSVTSDYAMLETTDDHNYRFYDFVNLTLGDSYDIYHSGNKLTIKYIHYNASTGIGYFAILNETASACPSPRNWFNDSSCGCVCPPYDYYILSIGRSRPAGDGWSVVLDEILSIGSDTPHNATFNITDSAGAVVGHISMAPASEYTYVDAGTGKTIKIKVLATTGGLSWYARWAEVMIDGHNCPINQIYNDSTCSCQQVAITYNCSEGNPAFTPGLDICVNDCAADQTCNSSCQCEQTGPLTCEQSIAPVCGGSCTSDVKSCTSLINYQMSDTGCLCDCPYINDSVLSIGDTASLSGGNFSVTLNGMITPSVNTGIANFSTTSGNVLAAENQSFVLTNASAGQTLTVVPVRNADLDPNWAEVGIFSDEITLVDGQVYDSPVYSSTDPNWGNIYTSLLWKNKDGSATNTQPDSLREVTLYTDDLSNYMGGDNRMRAGDSIPFPKADPAYRLVYNGLDLTDADYSSLHIQSVQPDSGGTLILGASSDCNTRNSTYSGIFIKVSSSNANAFGGSSDNLLGNDRANEFYYDPIGNFTYNSSAAHTQNPASSAWKAQIFWRPAGCDFYRVANVSITSNQNLGKTVISSYSNAVSFDTVGDLGSSPNLGLLKFYTYNQPFNAAFGGSYSDSLPGTVGEIILQEDAGKFNTNSHQGVMTRIPIYNITSSDWQFKPSDASTPIVYYNGINLSAPPGLNALKTAVPSEASPFYTERGTKVTDVRLTDVLLQAASRVGQPMFTFSQASTAYQFKTLITDTLDKALGNRMNTLPEDNYTTNLFTSDTSQILSPLRGVYAESQIARNLYRIGGNEFNGFADYYMQDNQAGFSVQYTEQQGFWAGTNSPANGIYYDSNTAFRQVIAKPWMIAYNMRFLGNDFGIPVCTGGLTQANDWTSCMNYNDRTDTHRLGVNFLGSTWVITNTTPPDTPLADASSAVSGGKIKLAKETAYNILSIGNSIPLGNGFSAKLVGVDSNGNAILYILDSNGNLVDNIQIPKGVTWTYTESGGQQVKIHIYRIGAGLSRTLSSEIRAYGPCDLPKIYNLTSCNCTCPLSYVINYGETTQIGGFTIRLNDTISDANGNTAILDILDNNGQLVGQIHVPAHSSYAYTQSPAGYQISIHVGTVALGITPSARWAQINEDASSCPTGYAWNDTTCSCQLAAQPACEQSDVPACFGSCTSSLKSCTALPNIPSQTNAQCSCQCPQYGWRTVNMNDGAQTGPFRLVLVSALTSTSATFDVYDSQSGAYLGQITVTNSMNPVTFTDSASGKSVKIYLDASRAGIDAVFWALKQDCPAGQVFNDTTCSCQLLPTFKTCNGTITYDISMSCHDDCKSGTQCVINGADCSCQSITPPPTYLSCSKKSSSTDPNFYCSDDCAAEFGAGYYCNKTGDACSCVKAANPIWACGAGPGTGGNPVFSPDQYTCNPSACSKPNYDCNMSACDCNCNTTKLASFCAGNPPQTVPNATSCSCACPAITCNAPKSLNQTTCACQCNLAEKSACNLSTSVWNDVLCTCSPKQVWNCGIGLGNGKGDTTLPVFNTNQFTCNPGTCTRRNTICNMSSCGCVCDPKAVDDCAAKDMVWDPVSCLCQPKPPQACSPPHPLAPDEIVTADVCSGVCAKSKQTCFTYGSQASNNPLSYTDAACACECERPMPLTVGWVIHDGNGVLSEIVLDSIDPSGSISVTIRNSSDHNTRIKVSAKAGDIITYNNPDNSSDSYKIVRVSTGFNPPYISTTIKHCPANTVYNDANCSCDPAPAVLCSGNTWTSGLACTNDCNDVFGQNSICNSTCGCQPLSAVETPCHYNGSANSSSVIQDHVQIPTPDACKSPTLPPINVFGVQLYGGLYDGPVCDPTFYTGCDYATNTCILQPYLQQAQASVVSGEVCGGSCPSGQTCSFVGDTTCACSSPAPAAAPQTTPPQKTIRYWYD